MKNDSLKNLIAGYKKFREEYVSENNAEYRSWAANIQKPETMVIACSDSRINPAILTDSGLGEIFMVNNVANLVPPYKEGHNTHHSTSAALEFAVCHLHVKQIIILGHSKCGGIKGLIDGVEIKHEEEYSFIEPWVKIAEKAKIRVFEKYSDKSREELECLCEKESLSVSLDNLNSFPWIKRAKDEGKLKTYAWYFDIGSGDISCYDPESKSFRFLLDDKK